MNINLHFSLHFVSVFYVAPQTTYWNDQVTYWTFIFYVYPFPPKKPTWWKLKKLKSVRITHAGSCLYIILNHVFCHNVSVSWQNCIFPELFPKLFPKPFPEPFPKPFPKLFSKLFSKLFPELFSKPFPKLFPKLFPEPFSKLSPKTFPELFPKPFPELFPEPMETSMLESDWLTPHHPILNAKFPPITVLLNRSTYHKSAQCSPPPCPQISE